MISQTGKTRTGDPATGSNFISTVKVAHWDLTKGAGDILRTSNWWVGLIGAARNTICDTAVSFAWTCESNPEAVLRWRAIGNSLCCWTSCPQCLGQEVVSSGKIMRICCLFGFSCRHVAISYRLDFSDNAAHGCYVNICCSISCGTTTCKCFNFIGRHIIFSRPQKKIWLIRCGNLSGWCNFDSCPTTSFCSRGLCSSSLSAH